MSNIIEVIKNAPDYIGGTGRTEEEIRNAEEKLGIKFAPDYREYLKEIGLACYDGHELTGICKSARLNVVDVTIVQRELQPEAGSWYVIEEANLDGIVVWQKSTGEIFQTVPGQNAKKICNSLEVYVWG